MIKLLYIVGDGRSGSTLLNIALGNHRDAVAVGELCNTQRYLWGRDNWCSCGARARQCGFWASVNAKLKGSRTDVTLQTRFESSRAVLQWPWWRHSDSDSVDSYLLHTLNVIKAVQTTSGKSLIVDASKLPGRAMALAMMPDIDLYIVHLVRDVRALVWARSKSWHRDLRCGIEGDVPAKSNPRVCFDWVKANLLSSRVRRQLPANRSICVRYEDFVTDSRSVLRRIGDMLQMEYDEIASALENGRPLERGHIASGNRMRMNEVTLKPDFAWTDHLPNRSQALSWALTQFQLRRFGYQRA